MANRLFLLLVVSAVASALPASQGDVAHKISADRIKVCVTDERAIVSAQSSSSQENAAQGSDGFVEELRSLYYVVRWPELIDPETCNAKFENGKLTLSARKALREAGGTSEDSAASDTRSAASRAGAS